MMRSLRTIVLSLTLISIAKAYPEGAPPEVCTTMMPGHGVEPQTSDPPFMIKIDVMLDGELIITLQSNTSEDTFKGFLMQVRDKNNVPFGAFEQEIESRLMDCPPGKNNSITHDNSDTDKLQIKTTWQCPYEVNGTLYRGEAYAIATVVREKTVFWVNITSDPFYINMP